MPFELQSKHSVSVTGILLKFQNIDVFIMPHLQRGNNSLASELLGNLGEMFLRTIRTVMLSLITPACVTHRETQMR